MVTHIVIFKWVPGVTGDQISAFSGKLTGLACDLGADIHHGPDLAFREGNGDYALVATFADQAAWNSYQADPRHQAFVRDVVTPIQASRLTIQF